MGIFVGTIVDDRGRITLPQEMRDALGLQPGKEVRVERVENGIVIRRAISKEEFIEKLEGCVDSSKVAGKRIDPLKIKDIWGAFHDHD